MTFCALVLAAGRSRRMGTPKAWLRFEGRSLLERIVDAGVTGGAFATVVVSGCAEDGDDPQLVSRIDVAMRISVRTGARLSVAVGEPDKQPIDSLRKGLELIPEGAAVLLWPVDAPFADAALVTRLSETLGAARDKIAIPKVGEKHCHPILLGTDVAAELMTSVADGGADAVVHRDPQRLLFVTAKDARLTRAINTPAEARALGIEVPGAR